VLLKRFFNSQQYTISLSFLSFSVLSLNRGKNVQNSFCFDQMKWIVVLLLSFIVFVAADKHLNANGPFGKHHTIDSEPNRRACKRPSGTTLSSIFESVSTLNISATTYFNKEQITVTWQSKLIPCEDDFIGVYFVGLSSVHIDPCMHRKQMNHLILLK
jgi:hypothetical protein